MIFVYRNPEHDECYQSGLFASTDNAVKTEAVRDVFLNACILFNLHIHLFYCRTVEADPFYDKMPMFSTQPAINDSIRLRGGDINLLNRHSVVPDIARSQVMTV